MLKVLKVAAEERLRNRAFGTFALIFVVQNFFPFLKIVNNLKHPEAVKRIVVETDFLFLWPLLLTFLFILLSAFIKISTKGWDGFIENLAYKFEEFTSERARSSLREKVSRLEADLWSYQKITQETISDISLISRRIQAHMNNNQATKGTFGEEKQKLDTTLKNLKEFEKIRYEDGE